MYEIPAVTAQWEYHSRARARYAKRKVVSRARHAARSGDQVAAGLLSQRRDAKGASERIAFLEALLEAHAK